MKRISKYTPELANELINLRIKTEKLNISFLGFNEWNGKLTKCILSCNVHGIWNSSSIASFLHKKTCCPYCANVGKLIPSNEEIKIQQIIDNNNMSIMFNGFMELDGCNTKIMFNCPIHGMWNTTTLASFKRQKSGCPQCSTHGYNIKNPGNFYIQELKYNNEIYYKFGITNLPVLDRVEQQKRNSVFEHKILYENNYIDGSIPQQLENEIKSLLKCGVIDKTMLNNGYTETINKDDYENLFNIVEKFKDMK